MNGQYTDLLTPPPGITKGDRQIAASPEANLERFRSNSADDGVGKPALAEAKKTLAQFEAAKPSVLMQVAQAFKTATAFLDAPVSKVEEPQVTAKL